MYSVPHIPEIPGYEFDEWLEDSGRFSRFGIKGTYDSVWICMDCEQLEEDCERDTEEFMDYWGYP